MKLPIIHRLLVFSIVWVFGCEESSNPIPSPNLPRIPTEIFLSNAHTPSVSPDGMFVLFRRNQELLARSNSIERTLLNSSGPIPTSHVSWVNSSEFVYSCSQLLESSFNGIFIFDTRTSQYEQLHLSGRDPHPLILNNSVHLIFEETDPQIGSGLFLIELSTRTRQATGLFGIKPIVSSDQRFLAYLTGVNGTLPALALLPNFANSFVIHDRDSYQLTFYNNTELFFDAVVPTSGRNSAIHIYKYNLQSNQKEIWFENGLQPFSLSDHRLTFRFGSGTSAELLHYRNSTLFRLDYMAGQFYPFPDGRIVYEKGNDLWISQ